MQIGNFDSLIPHMKRAGLVATATAAVITFKFGWALGEDVTASLALAILLALCTFIVGYALVAAYEAYRRQLYGVAAAATCLFVIAVCVEFMSHAGFTAANRDHNIKTVSHETEVAADNRSTIESYKAEIATLEKQRAMTPTRTMGQAQAVIDKSKAHKFWKSTSECAETKGAQTREFCDAYRAAVADIDGWKVGADREEKIASVRAKLIEAQKTAATAKISTAAAASQGFILAKISTASDNPTASAQGWALIGLSGLLALFAIASGGLLNFIAFALDSAGFGSATSETRTLTKVVHTKERDPRLDRAAAALSTWRVA